MMQHAEKSQSFTLPEPEELLPRPAALVPRSSPAPLDLSVVIPVHNEAGAILALLEEISEALDDRLAYEVVVIDDASTDGTGARLGGAMEVFPRLRTFRHRRRWGQSSALLTGVRVARAPWIATLDGDGQNDPRDILRLWDRCLERPQLTMICGIRRKRRDGRLKRLASSVANGVRRRVLGDGIADTGCGLKLFRRRLFLTLPAFDHMHRFLPALALAGGASLETVPVAHRPRETGHSKYGVLDRLAEGIVDLAGVWWLNRRRLAPRLEAPPREEPPAPPPRPRPSS